MFVKVRTFVSADNNVATEREGAVYKEVSKAISNLEPNADVGGGSTSSISFSDYEGPTTRKQGKRENCKQKKKSPQAKSTPRKGKKPQNDISKGI